MDTVIGIIMIALFILVNRKEIKTFFDELLNIRKAEKKEENTNRDDNKSGKDEIDEIETDNKATVINNKNKR